VFYAFDVFLIRKYGALRKSYSRSRRNPAWVAFLSKTNVSTILHITKREQWEKAKLEGVYRGDTLDSQGFIHCSTSQQIVKVANAVYRAQRGLVLLCIATNRVQSEIKYESAGSEELYPHIYGPLNTDVVVKVLDFEPNKDGKFVLPKKITKTKNCLE
jgi:uncharacterized protein (DUF952 family)